MAQGGRRVETGEVVGSVGCDRTSAPRVRSEADKGEGGARGAMAANSATKVRALIVVTAV